MLPCPYCEGTSIIKKGMRQKKREKVQLYYCKNCKKKFVYAVTKHNRYPLRVVLYALTLYNRLRSFAEVKKSVKERYGMGVDEQSIARWLGAYKEYLPFSRMREFAQKHYTAKNCLEESRMFHGQIYDFRYHRAKLDLVLEEEFRNYKFKQLKEFLELAAVECPHQVFRESRMRSSELKNVFNLDEVKIVSKTNAAVKMANFVLQAVKNNKSRHEVLQEFMLVNDSVTVATEVPVLLEPDDIRHFKHELNFIVPLETDHPITGHIDFVQVRNGMIHILDYKPSAKKEKPIDQLTLYALALSRLTGIRLFHFKCAWFDKENYFEFFPLHVVYKLKKGKKRAPKNQKNLFAPLDSKHLTGSMSSDDDLPVIQYT